MSDAEYELNDNVRRHQPAADIFSESSPQAEDRTANLDLDALSPKILSSSARICASVPSGSVADATMLCVLEEWK